ncbi:hypothetical protein [Nitrosomonas sp. HPC101]|uniref:hypothetical protein n=1 Tax=Nitrosomonas sp. HPC101 TaxID=1658667 RepID=UPI0013711F64|nr:hypothetical protein [Nitrosomonas sp. HPC101]
MSTTIELTTIKCNHTSELGSDEVYIKYSIDNGREQRFPANGWHSLSSGDTWDNVSLGLTFKDSVLIQLFDRDTFGDDSLGSHTYFPGDSQPETVTVKNPNGADYSLSTIAK